MLITAYFYPRSPCGERHDQVVVEAARYQFLSTLSLRRATPVHDVESQKCGISIHALLAESDPARCRIIYNAANFYPRSPCGERPTRLSVILQQLLFLSTLSLRRATKFSPAGYMLQRISIHALLAESDERIAIENPIGFIFLSTLSLRRATAAFLLPVSDSPISIHALLAESDAAVALLIRQDAISIHALLAESDHPDPARFPRAAHFYPRSPCGERRVKSFMRNGFFLISIHALLAESDMRTIAQNMHFDSISIHALLAESDCKSGLSILSKSKFLSTLSLRRATFAGRDYPWLCCYFYPRSPCGERRLVHITIDYCTNISIHALLAESDPDMCAAMHALRYFYPRSPCGERRRNVIDPDRDNGHFYPRSPCGERRKQGRHFIGCKIFLSTLSLRRATAYETINRNRELFLSTLSLRRATDLVGADRDKQRISIHALLAESDHHRQYSFDRHFAISIHALLAESDGVCVIRRCHLS